MRADLGLKREQSESGPRTYAGKAEPDPDGGTAVETEVKEVSPDVVVGDSQLRHTQAHHLHRATQVWGSGRESRV